MAESTVPEDLRHVQGTRDIFVDMLTDKALTGVPNDIFGESLEENLSDDEGLDRGN